MPLEEKWCALTGRVVDAKVEADGDTGGGVAAVDVIERVNSICRVVVAGCITIERTTPAGGIVAASRVLMLKY